LDCHSEVCRTTVNAMRCSVAHRNARYNNKCSLREPAACPLFMPLVLAGTARRQTTHARGLSCANRQVPSFLQFVTKEQVLIAQVKFAVGNDRVRQLFFLLRSGWSNRPFSTKPVGVASARTTVPFPSRSDNIIDCPRRRWSLFGFALLVPDDLAGLEFHAHKALDSEWP